MPLIFRDEQGVDLTADQVDGNFRFLEELIDELVANPPAATSITNITVSGATFTIWLSNGTSFGPFTMPMAAFHWREDGFLPDTMYFVGDFLPVGSSIYLVLQNHVTGDEFDSGAENSDEPIYQLLWSPASTTYSVVTAQSASVMTISADDGGKYFRCTNPAGCEVHVPDSGEFTVDTEVHFYQATDQPVVFVASAGATINPYEGHLKKTGGRGRVVTLKNVGLYTWDIFGGLAVGEDYET